MRFLAASLLALSAALAGCTVESGDNLGLTGLAQVGEVDERFVSYNVEMVEVTGGRFWRPYGSEGSDPYEYRGPMDLSDEKLRQLAAALGPSYVRVSGTWANATYFPESADFEGDAPEGFDTVLTHAQWRGVIGFAAAADGEIVTSFATSKGARDEDGKWTSGQAQRLVDFTKAAGGRIAAAEFSNEPNMLWLTQPPEGYGGEEYRADYTRFANWLRKNSPDTLLLAPGSAEIGEPFRSMSIADPSRPMIESDELITTDTPTPDAFSFHFYAGASQRCGQIPGFDLTKALDPEWLSSIDAAIARVTELRDRTAPEAPLWDTETGETACGGNPWAKTFADTFRFVDVLGRSAAQGVEVFMHNTLAASDYGLLDEGTHAPRPNYWAAVLWNRIMGTRVLEAPTSQSGELHLYAHCLRDDTGGVGLAAVNIGEAEVTINPGTGAQVWLLTAPEIDSQAMTVNGSAPGLSESGELTGLDAVDTDGDFSIPGQSIAFFAAPNASNAACE